MLTEDREKEIREKSKNWLDPDNGTRLYAIEYIPELLSEIDRLREENKQLKDTVFGLVIKQTFEDPPCRICGHKGGCMKEVV